MNIMNHHSDITVSSPNGSKVGNNPNLETPVWSGLTQICGKEWNPTPFKPSHVSIIFHYRGHYIPNPNNAPLWRAPIPQEYHTFAAAVWSPPKWSHLMIPALSYLLSWSLEWWPQSGPFRFAGSWPWPGAWIKLLHTIIFKTTYTKYQIEMSKAISGCASTTLKRGIHGIYRHVRFTGEWLAWSRIINESKHSKLNNTCTHQWIINEWLMNRTLHHERTWYMDLNLGLRVLLIFFVHLPRLF